ncbi:MAG: site-2 protease family protein [Candidatus Marinimicrobia bacterium]|nr:site-2 protease family protein [Candidatus Neomarinimicrobiota bacterium]
MRNLDPQTLVLLIPVILFALTVHEYAHGMVAYRLGDPTAKHAGRLTLNPLSHLDPVGTIMLFLVGLGWAKPVPVDPRYFANPKRDMLWVALAGPAANMGLALLSGLIIRFVTSDPSAYLSGALGPILISMMVRSLQINLMLAVFNLLPVPPLDGSKIMYSLLPPQYAHWNYNLERYGPMVLLGLVMMGMLTGFSILWLFIGPFVRFFAFLFAGI